MGEALTVALVVPPATVIRQSLLRPWLGRRLPWRRSTRRVVASGRLSCRRCTLHCRLGGRVVVGLLLLLLLLVVVVKVVHVLLVMRHPH